MGLAIETVKVFNATNSLKHTLWKIVEENGAFF
jgi:hypothetical protein